MDFKINSIQSHSESNYDTTRRMAANLNTIREESVAPGKKTFVGTLDDIKNPYEYDVKKTKSDEPGTVKKLNYNPNEIAGAIMRSKTSTSASGAVGRARRKVAELKRKLAKKDGDATEIQIALSHARSMERIAVKKKRHLELEELIKNATSKGNITDKGINAVNEENIKDLLTDEHDKSLDEIYEKLDEVMEESLGGLDEEIVNHINDVLSEYSKEFDNMLSEVFDIAEVADPNMSEEDFKLLKIKHDSSERKEIIKANMEYLKSMINYIKGAQSPSISANTNTYVPSLSTPTAPANVNINITL